MSQTVPENAGTVQLPCPRCGQMTACIQAYNVPVVVCLLVKTIWKDERVVGCPGCVRAALLRRLLLSIPLSNIVCWVFIPWHLAQLASSYLFDRPNIPPAEQAPRTDKAPSRGAAVPQVTFDWPPSDDAPKPSTTVVWVILGVVLVLVFVVVPRLMPG